MISSISPARPSPRTLTLYCGPGVEPWGPESLSKGIGGSEEAAILISRHLARLGWKVEVFAEPGDGRRVEHEGVTWIPYPDYSEQRCGSVFVAWRHNEFVHLAPERALTFHWLHNRQEWDYPSDVADRVDRIILVSRDHGRDPGFSDLDPRKIYISCNGLDEEFLSPPGNNEPHRIIYASCPARGLIQLLEFWPKIRRLVPDASLDVYYGFTRTYGEMIEKFPGLAVIRGAVYALLDQEEVRFHGMVGQDQLAKAFARAGVWAYPTETPETSCITAMKALAMGCLPVTTGYGALRETLGGRDLGPVHPSARISRNRWRKRKFLKSLVQAMRDGGSQASHARRLGWADWARRTYSWSSVAEDWTRMFAEVARERAQERLEEGS